MSTPGTPSDSDYQGLALCWAAEAARFLQEDPDSYDRFRAWQMAQPDWRPGVLVLTPKSLRGAEVVVLILAARLFGMDTAARVRDLRKDDQP